MRRTLRISDVIRYLLIPLAALLVYAGSFAYVSFRKIPDGVNYYFASRLWEYGLPAAGVLLLLIGIFFGLKLGNRITFTQPDEKLSASDVLLLLFPLTPIVQYLINNQDILSLPDVLILLGVFGGFSAVYILIIPALLGRVSSTRALMSVGLTFVFMLTNMAALSHEFTWYKYGSLKIQLLFLAVVLLAAWFLLNPRHKKFLYLLIVVNFVVNNGMQWYSLNRLSSSLPDVDNKLLSLIPEELPASTPNVYLLVYDAYVPNETMLAYGIDNSPQEDFLREQGFVLYPHTYSVGASTLNTMSRVLDVSSVLSENPRTPVSGNGIVHDIFHYFGYRTYGIFPYGYMFQGIGSTYDVSIPESSTPPYAYLSWAIFLGEFRFDIGFVHQNYEQYLENKQNILSNFPEDPIFFYTHSVMPNHSQNSGVCLPNENELYKDKLDLANLEMRQDVETILEKDPQAIIVVAGDHGPYLTKNCIWTSGVYEASEINRLDVQDRFGAFLAIRWPTPDYAQYDEITILQDVFPAILAYMYQDTRILEGRIEPNTASPGVTSGVTVKNGIISGGINDGEPLYLSDK